jgi:hypothetical protein
VKFRSARAALTLLAVAAALIGAMTASSVVRTEVVDGTPTAHLSRKSHTHLVLSARPKIGLRVLRPGSQRAATLTAAVGLCLLAAAGLVSQRRFGATPALVTPVASSRAPPFQR